MTGTDKGQSLFGTYARAPVSFERGEGVWVFDERERKYLDFGSGIAVNCLGHSHPHLVSALTEQANKIWHVSNLYEVPGQSRLADRLCSNSFADKVFFTNSGAEAVECAIKTARRFHYVNGNEKRTDIISFKGAFHGRTLATIAAGGQKKYLEGFGPKAPGFVQAGEFDIEVIKKIVSPTTAAIIIEPIQGEGGIIDVPFSFLRQLRALCNDEGILLIYDEIQTGIGRTGKLFAHEWSGVIPDLMAIAKGIGGGFPLGACMATAECAAGMTPGTHGTTYGGNPLAMAVGNAVLDVVLEPEFLASVRENALFFRQRLAELVDTYPQFLHSIRGEGMLIGLKCNITNTDVILEFRNEGMLAIPAGDNVVRLLPPLISTTDDIKEALTRMDKAFRNMASRSDTKGNNK